MIVDLFAGPGGWDEGLARLGVTDVVGLDIDPWACRSAAAAGHRRICADVGTYAPPAHLVDKVEGLIASPPCPDWSAAGKRAQRDGKTGYLVDVVPRWVETVRPRWVACEQVPPAEAVWVEHAHAYRALGYRTWVGILNAADYGIPQTRSRAILLATLDGVPHPSPPTHAKDPHPDLFGPPLRPWVSMADALGLALDWQVGFPRLDDTGTSPDGYRVRDWFPAGGPSPTVGEKARSWTVRTGQNSRITRAGATVPYERDDDRPAPTVTSQTRSWALRTGAHRRPEDRTLPRPVDQPAPTMAFGHASADWAWVLNTGRDWKEGGTRDDAQSIDLVDPAPTLTAKSGGQWQWRDRFVRGEPTDPDWPQHRPSTTVAGDPRIAQPGHKTNSDDAEGAAPGRMQGAIRLEPWEAAVLQDFPPDYPFAGGRTIIFRQIGDAVPPGLAAAVLAPLLQE